MPDPALTRVTFYEERYDSRYKGRHYACRHDLTGEWQFFLRGDGWTGGMVATDDQLPQLYFERLDELKASIIADALPKPPRYHVPMW